MNESVQYKRSLDWCAKYPLRMEVHNGDAPLFCCKSNRVNLDNNSMLSPVTNIILNAICSDNKASNFIICFPSSILKPLPLISYILADQNGSVLIFSNYNSHYKNYHLIKHDYGFVWSKIPAGLIDLKDIYIKPHTPFASRSFNKELYQRIPILKEKFLDENENKILFCQKSNLKFTNSVKCLYLNDDLINESYDSQSLGIKNIIFEYLDNYLYNINQFEIFKEWIKNPKEKGIRFVFHVSNPYYSLLNDLKSEFNAFVLYFPLSFLNSNDALKNKTLHYYKNINKQNIKSIDIIDNLNIDNKELYTEKLSEKIIIYKALRKGNIDRFFLKGINLFKRLDWTAINPDISILIYKLKQLFYQIFRMFAYPNEFSVKYFDEQLGYFYYPLVQYIPIVNKLIKEKSNQPTTYFLLELTSYLTNMMLELSECKRFGESKTYTRKGKNYALCKYLSKHMDEKIIIAAQDGERKAIYERIKKLELDKNAKIYTINMIAKINKEFPEHTLLLSGKLFPNHFSILLKSWKKVLFFTYKGLEKKWIEDQLKLLNNIDISKEELSLKYLAEILKELIVGKNYNLENDSIFKDFIGKKKKLLDLEHINLSSEENIFEIESKASNYSVTEIINEVMKSNYIYKETLEEEKLKKLIKKYEKEEDETFSKTQEKMFCSADLINEINGENIRVNLDINKRYMYFKDKANIKIEFGFPYSLNENTYLVLFGKNEKLSLTDFIKETFGLEEDIDYDLIDEWHGRLAQYYYKNYTNIKQFHNNFVKETQSSISYAEFGNWVRGNVNYTLDPENLYNLGKIMKDDFFIEYSLLICDEGKKIQKFNQKLTNNLKQIVKKVLDGNINREEISFDEINILDKIENCIFEIKNIQLKN